MAEAEDRRAGWLAGEWRRFGRGPVDWFLLTGDRLLVAALLAGLIAVPVWGTVLTGVATLEARTPVLYLLFALIAGNFTLITIVVSISQFVLARHLESPGEVREQLQAIVGYRQEVAELTGQGAVPVTPAGFLRVLFRGIDRDVTRLASREWEPEEAALATDVEHLLEALGPHARSVIELLGGGSGGLRQALFSTLEMNYSRFFYGVYRLRAQYGEALPEPVASDLRRIERHVEQVDVARRYFKTVLIQSELASLSRLLLAVGVPVLVVTVLLMLAFTATGGWVVSPRSLRVSIPLVVTAGFVPIVLLTAYILRLATVVHRTAAMYPFTTRGAD